LILYNWEPEGIVAAFHDANIIFPLHLWSPEEAVGELFFYFQQLEFPPDSQYEPSMWM
jgi:hypothetical protein